MQRPLYLVLYYDTGLSSLLCSLCSWLSQRVSQTLGWTQASNASQTAPAKTGQLSWVAKFITIAFLLNPGCYVVNNCCFHLFLNRNDIFDVTSGNIHISYIGDCCAVVLCDKTAHVQTSESWRSPYETFLIWMQIGKNWGLLWQNLNIKNKCKTRLSAWWKCHNTDMGKGLYAGEKQWTWLFKSFPHSF